MPTMPPAKIKEVKRNLKKTDIEFIAAAMESYRGITNRSLV